MLKRCSLLLLVVVFVAGSLTGCGGLWGGWGDPYDAPEWANNPPEEKNVIYAADEAKSRNRRIAVRRAETRATAELASIITTDIEAKIRDDLAISGEGKDEEAAVQAYSEQIKESVEQELRGAQRDRVASKKNEDGVYRAFVLMRLRFDDYEEFLQDQMQELTELKEEK